MAPFQLLYAMGRTQQVSAAKSTKPSESTPDKSTTAPVKKSIKKSTKDTTPAKPPTDGNAPALTSKKKSRAQMARDARNIAKDAGYIALREGQGTKSRPKDESKTAALYNAANGQDVTVRLFKACDVKRLVRFCPNKHTITKMVEGENEGEPSKAVDSEVSLFSSDLEYAERSEASKEKMTSKALDSLGLTLERIGRHVMNAAVNSAVENGRFRVGPEDMYAALRPHLGKTKFTCIIPSDGLREMADTLNANA